jgi:hypothetical protein
MSNSEVASVNERLLDITMDIHRLHHIRESPEYQLFQLQAGGAVLRHRLA